MKINSGVIPLLMILCGLTGCRTYDGDKIRQEHATAYPVQLAEKTADVLGDDQELDLYDCIRIAMDNSLDVQSAALQQRAAKLDKNVSFSNFLPAVTLNTQKIWWDPMPMIKFGNTGVTMHDKEVREVSWNIQMSIFNPATWFLHGMYSQGYEIAGLVHDYTRQAIAFQVTTQYYQCLALARMLEALEKQETAARTLAWEVDQMNKEGLVSTWQADQARADLLARELEVHSMQRAVTQARAELLALMGLSPVADLRLAEDAPLVAPEGALADLITEALLNHPSLAIEDRQIAIEREKVKLAVSNFLPSLVGVASYLDTSDSHQVHASLWTGGIMGTLTVFNGFANINQYKAAKVHREAAFVQREQATLSLILQVIRAYDQIQTAREQVALAQSIEAAAESRLAEVQQHYKQGLIQTSALLAVTAEAHTAHIQALQAGFQYQVSIALMKNVLGQFPIGIEELQP